MKLTVKQQRFADESILTGNISEAYRKAYPNVTKEGAAFLIVEMKVSDILNRI